MSPMLRRDTTAVGGYGVVMLKPHELTRARQLTDVLRDVFTIDVVADSPGGPFGRTLASIEAYRRIKPGSHGADRARELLADLICVYAVGIVRGDGVGIASDVSDG